MVVDPILDTLKELLKIPAVVRFEQPLLNYLESYCNKIDGYECFQEDRLLIVRKKESTSKKAWEIVELNWGNQE